MSGSLSAIAIYGGLLGLLALLLSVNVTRLRASHHALFGDADNDELRRAIRAQANAMEYIPLCILLMLIMAYTGYAAWLVHVLGIVLVAGRHGPRLWHNRPDHVRTAHAGAASARWLPGPCWVSAVCLPLLAVFLERPTEWQGCAGHRCRFRIRRGHCPPLRCGRGKGGGR